MRTIFGVFAIIFLLSYSPSTFAAQATGEWWEVTQKMEMPGMPELSAMIPGGGSSKICMANGQANTPYQAGDESRDCEITDVKPSGNTTTFKIKCTGNDPMTGTGDITHTANSFNQKIQMHSSDGDMQMIATGKKVGGTCNVQEETTKMAGGYNQQKIKDEGDKATAFSNKIKVDSAAAMKDFCTVDTKTLNADILAQGSKYFAYDRGAGKMEPACKSEQKAYCAQVRNVAGSQVGYGKYNEIRQAFIDKPDFANLKYSIDPVKTCKIDPAPLLPNACASAKKDALKANPWESGSKGEDASFDVDFMTDYCPADAKAYIQKVCANWQKDGSANYDRHAWCNWKAQGAGKSGKAPVSKATNPPAQQTRTSKVVEESKTQVITEGVKDGVKKGFGALKGLFK